MLTNYVTTIKFIFSIRYLPYIVNIHKKTIYNKQSVNNAIQTTISTLESLRQHYEVKFLEIFSKANKKIKELDIGNHIIIKNW